MPDRLEPGRSASYSGRQTGGVNHVVEILQISLRGAERDIADASVDIPGIFEQDAADVLPDERKTQFHIVEQDRIATQRESGRLRGGRAGSGRSADVARSRLILREAAVETPPPPKKRSGSGTESSRWMPA